jgi:DNA invertase Pin-like site-specific DNA recombinase
MSKILDSRKIAYSYIRFSTPEQIKGDSLRRQKEASEIYAKEHNLRLDSSLRMEDLGVSAFKGKNYTHGALKEFMTAIEQKKVPIGSFLLVESLDRLSRADVLEAFEQFSTIIRGGVTIVTLLDKMVYSRESIEANPMTLFGSIAVMLRANEEVKTKAERISKAWEKKRLDALYEKKPLTSRCPAWIELKDQKYVLIEERADIVRRIFSLYINGYGKRSIAKIFNEEGIDTWRCKNFNIKANGWHDSYIQKILNNEAVLGRYQPHVKSVKSPRRTPVGESIEDYFPPVIEAKLWQLAHCRPPVARGRKGSNKKVSNLFSGIVFDGYNGSRMRYIDKGGKRGHGKYLSSDIKRLKPSSKGQNWPYPEFEKMMLSWLEGLNWENLHSHSVESEIGMLQSEKDQYSIKNEKLEKDLSRYLEFFSDEKNSLLERIREKTRKIDLEIESNKEKILYIDAEINRKTETEVAISEGFKKFKKLVSDNSQEGRIRLQLEIRRRIKIINLFRYGGLKFYGKGGIAEKMSKLPAIQIIYQNDLEEHIRFDAGKTLAKSMIEWTNEYIKNPTDRKSRYKLLNKIGECNDHEPLEINVLPQYEHIKNEIKAALKKRHIEMVQLVKDQSNLVYIEKSPFFKNSKGENVGMYMKKTISKKI